MRAAVDVKRRVAFGEGGADNADCLFAHVCLRMTEARAGSWLQTRRMRFVNWGGARDGVPDRLSRKETLAKAARKTRVSAARLASSRERRAERADAARLPL